MHAGMEAVNMNVVGFVLLTLLQCPVICRASVCMCMFACLYVCLCVLIKYQGVLISKELHCIQGVDTGKIIC